MATLNIKNLPDRIYRRLKRLAEREHRSIAQQVIHMISQATEAPPAESLLELRGRGKELWRGIDASDRVAAERRSWD